MGKNESVKGLTFEQAEKLINKKKLKFDSYIFLTTITYQLTSEDPSGIIDLGPIPEAEQQLIPKAIIDSSQQKLIEENIQQLIRELLPDTEFTLTKGSSGGYEFAYKKSAVSMNADTARLIDFGIRLFFASQKSFYIHEQSIDLLKKLAKNIKGGAELIKPLEIKTKSGQPLLDKAGVRVSSSSSYTPAMFAPDNQNPDTLGSTPSKMIKPKTFSDENQRLDEIDKRFKKSTQDGVLFEAASYGMVTDDELRSYGATKWSRKKDGFDNVVLVLEMTDSHQLSEQPSGP